MEPDKKRDNIKQMISSLVRTGFFHIFSSSVINKMLTFLSNIVVVRFVSKVDYGVFAYADNMVSMVLLASGMGMVSGTFQLCSEKKKNKEKDEVFRYGTAIGIRVNIILCLIIAFISQFVPVKFNSASEYLLLLSINPILMIIFEFQQIYFRSRTENKKYSFASTFNTFLVVMGAIIGVFIASIDGMIVGRNIAYILTIIIVSVKLSAPIYIKKEEINKEDKIALFKISFISMLNNGISHLLYLLDVFLLGIILSNEEIIASYKVATTIPAAMIFIPTALVTYIYPYFASKKDDKYWCLQQYKKIIKYFGAFNLLITIGLILLAKPIIVLLYGTQYTDAVTCFRILAVNYFISGTFRSISGNLLVTQRKLGFNLIVNVISGSVNIIGNLILIPLCASIGAALTTLTVSLVAAIMSTGYYIYILKHQSE